MNRIELAKKSLIGLSIGDCFGETFFGETETILKRISERKIITTTWNFTDDTVMGIGIFKTLERHGKIDQDFLSNIFAENYKKDCRRGYGGTIHSVLQDFGRGLHWSKVSPKVFDGTGSMGNGSAMRVAPVGAYFHDDIDMVIKQAELSAEITHYNKEGIAGAISVAVASYLAVNMKTRGYLYSPEEFINKVADLTPESDTKYKIKKAATIKNNCSIDFLVSVLGNGSKVTVPDTVPISIWFSAHYINDYTEAMWQAVSALGDRDTICAIVGGIVILNNDNIPEEWLNLIERFEDSIFYN